MKNDTDNAINKNEKEKKHFQGVIIKDRETLHHIIKKAGAETIETFCRVDKDFARDLILGLRLVAMITIMQEVLENAIMPRGIDE